jgi:hypothetical protein
MNHHVTLLEPEARSAELIIRSAPTPRRMISAAELEALFTAPDTRQLPRSFDRLAIRLGIALLLWGRKRTGQDATTAAEHTRIRQGIRAAEAREHALQREFPHRFI